MGEKKHIVQWAMEPTPSYNCHADFFDDGSAEFFDEPARHRESDRGSNARRILFGIFSEDDRHLADEVCRHTRTFRVSDDLLRRIIAANDQVKISDSGDLLSDLSEAAQNEIDAELNAIFWRDINPLLTEPLDQPS